MSPVLCGLVGIVGVVLSVVGVLGSLFVIGLPAYRLLSGNWTWHDGDEFAYVATILVGALTIMTGTLIYFITPPLVEFGCKILSYL